MVTGPPHPHHEPWLRGPSTLNSQPTYRPDCLLPLFTAGHDTTARHSPVLEQAVQSANRLPPGTLPSPAVTGDRLRVRAGSDGEHLCARRMSPRLIWIPALSRCLFGVGDGTSLGRAGSSGPFFSTFLLMSLCSWYPRKMCDDSGLFHRWGDMVGAATDSPSFSPLL